MIDHFHEATPYNHDISIDPIAHDELGRRTQPLCNLENVRRHRSVGRKRINNNVIGQVKVHKDQTMPHLNYEQDIIEEKNPSPISDFDAQEQPNDTSFKITTKILDQSQLRYMKMTQNKFSDKRNQFYRENNSEL